jgi:hypothetical protein
MIYFVKNTWINTVKALRGGMANVISSDQINY